jgi:hypothetical protein
MTKIEVRVPFMGFYETYAHDKVADSISNELFDRNYEEVNDDDELSKVHALFKDRQIQFCREYVKLVSKEIGIDLEFVEMTSPREYNFATDRIFAKMDESGVETLKNEVNPENIRQYVKDHFTSYSGFSSFYDNDYDKWLNQGEQFDHNQVGALIDCILEDRNADWQFHLIDDMDLQG